MLIGVETGGTKILCALADSQGQIADVRRFDTRTPQQTLPEIIAFVRSAGASVEAIGVASFGPVGTNPDAAGYGRITSTPKIAWRGTDLHTLGEAFGSPPMAFVTDVSGALLGERMRGAGRGFDDLAYVTVGTGVGIGLCVRGALVSAHGSPELGHMLVRRHPDDDFAGLCPFHGDCLEGLASGPAVSSRWGGPASSPRQVDILAFYVAQLVQTIVLSVAPGRIVLGGGVSKTPGLLDAVRNQAATLMAGYLGAEHPVQRVDSGFITVPQLGDLSGVHGALALAAELLAARPGVVDLSDD